LLRTLIRGLFEIHVRKLQLKKLNKEKSQKLEIAWRFRRTTHSFVITTAYRQSASRGFSENGLPLGLQVVGPQWGEGNVLDIAHRYQNATKWHLSHPASNLGAAGRMLVNID
jgi:Asp-tRNA(Asn)/Glu-tRNA(Gln) amidotransferase A subunit family amidase